MATTIEIESFQLDPATHYQCFDGKPFYPFDPMRSLDCFTVEAIANGLARICRFRGRTKRFYSVAEHSLYVSGRLPEELEIYGLLHDAHEAFSPFGDVPTPCKLGFIDDIEAGIDAAIAHKFKLDERRFWVHEIDAADRFMLAQEKAWLMEPSDPGIDWGVVSHIPVDPEYSTLATPTSASEIAEAFATKFRKLLPKRR